MEQRRFLNQSQPQTLVIATLLLYLNAVFSLLGGNPIAVVGALFGSRLLATLILFAIVAALAAGGYGIANETKWGYNLAVGAAVAQFAALLLIYQLDVLTFPIIITLVFDGALVALLVHPMSRDYTKIWFK